MLYKNFTMEDKNGTIILPIDGKESCGWLLVYKRIKKLNTISIGLIEWYKNKFENLDLPEELEIEYLWFLENADNYNVFFGNKNVIIFEQYLLFFLSKGLKVEDYFDCFVFDLSPQNALCNLNEITDEDYITVLKNHPRMKNSE